MFCFYALNSGVSKLTDGRLWDAVSMLTPVYVNSTSKWRILQILLSVFDIFPHFKISKKKSTLLTLKEKCHRNERKASTLPSLQLTVLNNWHQHMKFLLLLHVEVKRTNPQFPLLTRKQPCRREISNNKATNNKP